MPLKPPHDPSTLTATPPARRVVTRQSPPPRERVRKVDLSVAVVNYRSMQLLLDSARTWRAAAGDLEVEWRVLENGTGEPITEPLLRIVPDARVTMLDRSVSFAKANNIALRGFRGRHVALVNPDTLLQPDSLARLVRYLDHTHDVGVVGPRVYDDAERTRLQRSWRRLPSLATALFSRYSLASRLFPNNRWTRRYLNLDRDPNQIQDTDWVSGCCLVVRGSLFRELGGLDAGYPMFCEDVDLCRSATARQQRVVYCPEAEIVHLVGGSRRRAPLRSEWLRHRSMTHYVFKYRHVWNPISWLLTAGIWTRFLLLATRSVCSRSRGRSID